MAPDLTPDRASASRRGGLAHVAVALAATAAAFALLDRLALRDAYHRPDGTRLCRGRIVPPPSPSPASQAPRPAVFVRLLGGPDRGKVVGADYAPTLDASGDALLGASVFVELAPPDPPVVRAVARDRTLLYLAGVLVALVVVIAGRSVWRLLPALLAGVGVLLGILLPLLQSGFSPLAAGLLAGAVFLSAGAILIGRASRRSVAIFAGGAGGLVAAAALAVLAVHVGRLTGVYSNLTDDLWQGARETLDFRQLLCAGMIVGACGIILDLAAAIASAVHQVAQADPGLARRRLAAAGLAVGRDVIGTELNTLIFAYAGAHLGIVLLPMLPVAVRGFEHPALLLLSDQAVAVEVYHMLVGTTALVLTIPITAVVAAALLAPGRARGAVRTLRRGLRPSKAALPAAALVVVAWALCSMWHGRLHHRWQRRPGAAGDVPRYLVQAEVTGARPTRGELLAAGPPRGERHQQVAARLTSGPHAGRRVESIANSVSGRPSHDKLLDAGDAVLLQVWAPGGRITQATVMEFSRGQWMIHFAFLLVAVVLLVGRRNGLRALAALAVSGAIVLAAVLCGASPPPGVGALGLFLLAAVPLCAVVFLILAGPGRKALSAATGTFGGLLVGAACALLAAGAMRLSGLESDSMRAIYHHAKAPRLDYRGLLQAGIVLGVLGAAMDVAIAISSAAEQVRLAKPSAGRGELFARGLAVGRGIMVPMVLVLTFAYIALNLPLLILPPTLPTQPVALLLSNERISPELLRILVGGIGVVCTVPITAAAAAVVLPWRRGARAGDVA